MRHIAFVTVLGAAIATAQKPSSSPNPVVTDGPCAQPFTSTLVIPLDNTFSVVQMDGAGGSGPANPLDPCQLNDDDFTLAIPLGFSFNMFGTTYTSVHINNNGNVSFGGGFATYTSSGFPVSGFPMVAPFWGDVDTRQLTPPGGTVWMRLDSNRLIVIWDHVGYYNANNSLLNTFELVISDGTDPSIGLGNNVCFSYDDMQWTTGTASGGSGGYGGVPATVGVNAGDGVNFFQIGRFDHAGTDYDGPGGNNDGVDWLDGQAFCFTVDTNNVNTPPIAVNLPSGNHWVCPEGVPTNITIDWIPPELGQNITSITVNSFGLANFVVGAPVLGPNGSITCTFTPDGTQFGPSHVIDVTATDDFSVPASTTIHLFLDVCSPATCGAIGVGCGGTGHTAPSLVPTSLPTLGGANTIELTAATAANQASFLTLGLSSVFDPIQGALPADLSAFGLTGCSMNCGYDIGGFFSMLDGLGMTTASITIPNTLELCNLPVCWQGYVHAPGANPAEVIVSNGTECRVGL